MTNKQLANIAMYNAIRDKLLEMQQKILSELGITDKWKQQTNLFEIVVTDEETFNNNVDSFCRIKEKNIVCGYNSSFTKLYICSEDNNGETE